MRGYQHKYVIRGNKSTFKSPKSAVSRNRLSQEKRLTPPHDDTIARTPTRSLYKLLENEIGLGHNSQDTMEKEDPKIYHAMNRIVHLDSLVNGIEVSLCCRKCAENKRETDIKAFIEYIFNKEQYMINKDT